MSPKKCYEKPRQKVFADDFDRDAIHRNIHRMYDEKRHLTLTIILEALREDDLFSGGCTSLAKLLKDMEFSYKKSTTKGAIIVVYSYSMYFQVRTTTSSLILLTNTTLT